jgi:hypothetical protein
VRKWKNDVAGNKKPEPGTSKGTGGTASTTTTTATKTDATSTAGQAVSPVLPTKGSSEAGPTKSTIANGAVKTEDRGPSNDVAKKDRNANLDGIPKVIVNDKVRDGSIILLYNAIVLESTECVPLAPSLNLTITNVCFSILPHPLCN